MGMLIQRILLSLEGVKIPSIEEILSSNPKLTVADAINIQRDIYGAEVDWEAYKITVRFHGERYDITEILIKIVNENSYGDVIDELGMDTRGFNFSSAVRAAQKEIISKIVSGTMTPKKSTNNSS